jgi:hypothetical protein
MSLSYRRSSHLHGLFTFVPCGGLSFGSGLANSCTTGCTVPHGKLDAIFGRRVARDTTLEVWSLHDVKSVWDQ